MRYVFTVGCLCLGSFATALNNPSSEAQQSTPNAQVQPQSNAPQELQKDTDKQPDSVRDHKPHVRLGSISLSAGYVAGPPLLSPWPYYFYPPAANWSFFPDAFFSPFAGPYWVGFAYGPDKGWVKLSARPKNAEVFLDGAYAGTADHLKDMWLDPGVYNISVAAPGHAPFQQRIYVLSGKELKIDARLELEKKQKSQTEEKP
jgi:hypothetical protein